MRLAQFLKSIKCIRRAAHVGTFRGVTRHLTWQMRKLAKGFPVALRLSDSCLHVDRAGGVAALVNSLGVYDYNNMNLIKLLLDRTGGVFFDVGANVGSYTLVASEALGRVVSFEPHPAAFASLHRNILLNRRDNVTVRNVAVSDHCGRLLMTNKPQLAINHIVAKDDEDDNAIEVEATTLDETSRLLSMRANVVKIDVEGHEGKVLDGFHEGIETVDVIAIENGQRDEIQQHPTLRSFIGPCYFHFDSGAFSFFPQRRKEDPIFVRREAIDRLQSYGLSFRGIRLAA